MSAELLIGDSDITFTIMNDVAIIKLTKDYAELYGERISDNGKLYKEMLDWTQSANVEGRVEPVMQDIPRPRGLSMNSIRESLMRNGHPTMPSEAWLISPSQEPEEFVMDLPSNTTLSQAWGS